MLNARAMLVLHEVLLTFAEHLGHQTGDVGFVAELRDRGEEGLEVEADGGGEGEATQRLPVDAKVEAVEAEIGVLGGPVLFVGVARGLVKGLVDLDAPGSALDGTISGHFGEETGIGMTC